MQNLFEDDDAYDLDDVVIGTAKCTPETLLAFVELTRRTLGRSPTMLECKMEFGGILGVYVAGWELQRRGLLK